ncbi:nucleotide sugar dehydrogenase [Paenibacillus gansuensis]|uniref:Nucleotide sugar dehydrogenase n=1 Tax=Paenibacillus gansuensis TaxID=306542 RepID=A0ABW5PJ38_9BACL
MDAESKLKHIGIIGLGYVGLPLAIMFVEHGYQVTGIELDKRKIASLREGKSYISDITNNAVLTLMKSGAFEPAQHVKDTPPMDAYIICVPTPLNSEGKPDLRYVEQAASDISNMELNGQLVVLESSTYPGTTEEVLVPILERGGRKAGRDFYAAYSPERINPGDTRFARSIMPKIISGITPACTQKVSELYSPLFNKIVSLSTTRAAEMAKVLENSQRFINISFLNEVTKLCDKMDINVWEVIDAINTKPYGNLHFYPGSGVGGHCIPVDPLYLDWKADQVGVTLPFLKVSKQVNDSMPAYVVSRINKLLPQRRLSEASIFLLGLTYKKDVNDLRESSACDVMSLLVGEGAKVSYYDPYIPELNLDGKRYMRSELTDDAVASADCVVLLTDHSALPIERIISNSKLLFDTRNATSIFGGFPNVVKL